MNEVLLEMKNIRKEFPGVVALDNAGITVRSGEVVALLGENGAGKSTLMKVLTGVYQRDGGSVRYRNQEVAFQNPREAAQKGIVIIHQELNLVPYMTVYENIYMGRELHNKLGHLDTKAMIQGSKELLGWINAEIDPKRPVQGLSIAKQQMVEIAKALALNSDVIVMDEPTDALPDDDVDSLLAIVEELRAQGKGIVYITHRLQEVFQVCDRVTVLRDGQLIGERLVKDLDYDELVRMMVGRQLTDLFPYDPSPDTEDVVLKVEGLTNQYVKDISFSVKRGSIVGIAGLAGAGRTELAKTLFGVYPKQSGKVLLNQKQVEIRSPKQAIQSGIFYVSEDRKAEGLILSQDVKTNITLSSLKKIVRFGRVNRKKERKISEEYRKEMNIRTPNLEQLAKNLSGGNQQKIVLSKGLMSEPELLILDEPTRGIDVGAKKEVYNLTNIMKRNGKAILMISSEMPEILGICDEVIVMHEGRIKGRFTHEDVTQEKIMETIMRDGSQPKEGV